MDTQQRLLNTIIVASGKGGVGKTWFSINLAQALGNQKKRVLLFDGDMGLANVDVQLGLKPTFVLDSILKNKCTFKEAILSYKPRRQTSTPIDIITNRTPDGIFTNVSRPGLLALKNSLTTVAPTYDHLILDVSAGLDPMIQEFSTLAHKCLIVITDDSSSISDALAFINVMDHRNPGLSFHIVVNKAVSEPQGQQTYKKFCFASRSFLKNKPLLAGIIHRDNSVPSSISKKIPTLISHPTSQASRDIELIAKEMLALK